MDRKGAGARRCVVETKSQNRRSVAGYGKLSPTSRLGASNDRVDMLLMEANEISQYLNKDYVRPLFIRSLLASSAKTG